MELDIKIKNITEAQAVAIEDMLAEWNRLGNIGSSRWTSFYADGDGNFRPKILVNNSEPKLQSLLPRSEFWDKGVYKMDFDKLAWKLDKK